MISSPTPIEVLADLSLEIRAARTYGAEFTIERDAKILEYSEAGALTQQQIAEATGLSPIRVRQIIKAQRDRRAESRQERNHG